MSAIDAVTTAMPTEGDSGEAPIPATMPEQVRLARLNGSLAEWLAERRERECLAIAVYFEARGETPGGQAAVAQVIINRAKTKGFPDTICGVVYEGQQRRNACQFSFACDGQPDRIAEMRAWSKAKEVAADVSSGKRRSGMLSTATHYHATYVSPYWAPAMKRLAQVGRHVFYEETTVLKAAALTPTKGPR